jgi:CHASE2 domain-containing sensor protein
MTDKPPTTRHGAPPIMRQWPRHVYIAAVVLGFLAFTALVHLPVDTEHWSDDLIISLFSKRAGDQDQHKRIVLVYVSDATLEDRPYTSPIDRGILADLIKGIDDAGAKVIGLDIILDRCSEPDKDAQLRRTYRNAKATMVLGAIDEPKGGEHVQSEYFFAKTDGTDPKIGHLYFDERHPIGVISDHVIRFTETPPIKDSDDVWRVHESLAEAMAQAGGSNFRPESAYIDWLLPPNNGDGTFLTLTAENIIGPGNAKLAPAVLSNLLGGKIVLIGADLVGRDKHLIPLSVIGDIRYTGTFIHAQVLTQLLDQRSIQELNPSLQFLLALAAGLGGFLLGRRSGHRHLWLEAGAAVVLWLIGIPAFWLLKLIVPYNVFLIAWLCGAAVGHYALERTGGDQA